MNTIFLSDLNIYEIGNSLGIAGIIYSDASRVLLCPLVGLELTGEMSILRMDTEDWTKFLRQTDLQEVEVQTPEGKAILRKSNRMIDANVSWAVYRRDGYSCRYCGNTNAPLTVDHAILWEDNGPSIEENLLSSCRKCNKKRGNMPFKDWLESDYYKRVVSPHDWQHNANLGVLKNLDSIPRVNHVRSR